MCGGGWGEVGCGWGRVGGGWIGYVGRWGGVKYDWIGWKSMGTCGRWLEMSWRCLERCESLSVEGWEEAMEGWV